MSRRRTESAIGPSKLIEDPEQEQNFASVLDNRIAALEERLNACDSFFQLTSQNSKIQEKQQKQLAKSIANEITKLEQKEMHLKTQLSSLQRLVRDAVSAKTSEIESQATELYTLTRTAVEDKLNYIEEKFIANNDQINLLIDEIAHEVDQLRSEKDSGARIAEMLSILEGLESQQISLAASLS